MKYCLNGTQPKTVLEKADEIKIDFKSFDYLIDLIVDFPKKKIIVRLKDVEANSPAILKRIKDFIDDGADIEVCLESMEYMGFIRDFYYKIPFYLDRPVNNFIELRRLKAEGVSQIIVDDSLGFDLEMVSRFEIPIRAIPNKAYAFDKGNKSFYIRPEDVKYYEQYITTLEFYSETLAQETKLYEIYSSGVWNGNLGLLIVDLTNYVDNRGLSKNFGERRLNCGQKCMRQGTCHFCDRDFLLCTTVDQMINKS